MSVAGQLQRGRVLHARLQHAGVRCHPAQQHLGSVPHSGRLPERGRECRNHRGIVRVGRQLQRGRVLPKRSRPLPPFVVSQKGGTWEKAIQVPGSLFNVGIFAGTFSVSCRSARNCSAGGDYNSKVATKETQPWVDSWGPATPVPGRVMIPAKLSANGYLTRVCHAVPANVALTPRGEGLDWSNQVTGA